ncbi:MAG: hypothetical protein MJ252_07155 [archaeon]|nr:hypothetical protein [archaeon]
MSEEYKSVEDQLKSDEVKEETKTEETKTETESKKEEEESQPKVESMPVEPEPKIPSDYTSEINELSSLKTEGNNLIGTDVDQALSKYNEAYNKMEELMKKARKEKEYNPQIETLEKLEKQITSNLALCYYKKKEYEKCIDLDISIISKDPYYDKSYARLFNSYNAIGNKDNACYFGIRLKKNFTEETLGKYQKEIEEINKLEEELTKKYAELIAKQKREVMVKFFKYFIPVVVLISAGLIWFFFFRKKKQIK